ncbi:hypothetical protein GCM10009578_054230 [Streptomyces rhizosphaericus]
MFPAQFVGAWVVGIRVVLFRLEGEGRGARGEGRAMGDVVSTFVQVRTLIRTDPDSPSMTRP